MSSTDFVALVEARALRAAALSVGLLGMAGSIQNATMRRKMVEKFPGFMIRRALAVKGWDHRAAIEYIKDNVDQPAEFWQSESERAVSREPSAHSQLVCSRLQTDGASCSTQPQTAETSATTRPVRAASLLASVEDEPAAAAEQQRTGEARWEGIGPADVVEVDTSMSDEAIRHRLRLGRYNAELLPQSLELPRWAAGGDDASDRRSGWSVFGSGRPPRSDTEWELRTAESASLRCVPLVAASLASQQQRRELGVSACLPPTSHSVAQR